MGKKIVSLKNLTDFCMKYVFDSKKQAKVPMLSAEEINKIYERIRGK